MEHSVRDPGQLRPFMQHQSDRSETTEVWGVAGTEVRRRAPREEDKWWSAVQLILL